MDVSAVIASKDRHQAIKDVIQSCIDLPMEEIILVDWGSVDPLIGHVGHFTDPRLKLIRVDTEEYIPAVVDNFRVSVTKCPYVFLIHADTPLSKDIFERYQLQEGILYRGGTDATCGTCVFHRKWFEKVNGFNERMRGWGVYDSDFYERCVKTGLIIISAACDAIHHVDHDNYQRTKNFGMTIGESSSFNCVIHSTAPWTIKDKRSIIKYTVLKG